MAKRGKAKAKRRSPLSRERVLRSAMSLADARGIDALTMRELGKALDVEAMSLYNHVANKDDILDGLVELVVSDIELPARGVDWKTAMRRRAISAHEVFQRHPWAGALIDSRTSAGPARLRYFDSILGCLRQAGFSMAQAVQAFSTLDSYIYGFGIQQLNLEYESEEQRDMIVAAFLQAVPADEYPNLFELVTEHVLKNPQDTAADFAFGLDLILDGLERRRR